VNPSQADAWKGAAGDLGFRFISPFSIESGGTRIEYVGHLPEFGSAKGMLVIADPCTSAQIEAAQDRGFGYSCVTVEAVYDRAAFVELLCDWGWSGPEEHAPAWLR
jgi:hypothetical protein